MRIKEKIIWYFCTGCTHNAPFRSAATCVVCEAEWCNYCVAEEIEVVRRTSGWKCKGCIGVSSKNSKSKVAMRRASIDINDSNNILSKDNWYR